MADDIPVDETADEGFVTPEQQPQPMSAEELAALPQRIRVDGDDGDDGGEAGEPGDDPDEPETVELTAEERRQFRTLLTIGKRTKTVPVFDHSVVIQSLSCDDELRIGLYVKDHRDSTGYSRAYQCATVAASIKSVDGEQWGVGLTTEPDPDSEFERKYKKVVKLHPMVVQMIYNEINKLDLEFAELAAKVGKL